MDRQWVVKASPIITLAKIDHVHLLMELSPQIVIPTGVYEEVNAGSSNDPGRQWINSDGKKWVMDVSPIHPSVTGWDLGLGESEVLSYAIKNPGFEVIIDGLAARNCASAFKIKYRGTIGLILLAKREKKIPAISSLLDQLQQSG